MVEIRCSDVSALLGEPLAGTAPSDSRWLFVEHPGPWGPKAPADVLPVVEGVRTQLIRRVGRETSAGVRVFAADLTGATQVRTVSIGSIDELGTAGPIESWPSYDGLLWLVCTNGRRDECCASLGRPVAAALAERWPEETWQTTHLGGHRFAPTLLALPSGYVLGRVTDAIAACESLAAGELPLDLLRGRAGLPPAAQAAELFVRAARGLSALGDVRSVAVLGDLATVSTTDGNVLVRVEAAPGESRRTSCADVEGKPVTSWIASAG